MPQVIVLSFFAGLMGANGIPHFVSGITRREYPNLTGNSAVRNVIAGWAALVIAALLGYWADMARHPLAASVAVALGVLAMGVFHAYGGAFRLNSLLGRANPTPDGRDTLRR